MFCTQCGAKLVAGAKFCTKCGKPVQSTQPQQQPQVSAPTPAVTPPVEPVAAPAQPAPSPASFPPAQSAPAQPVPTQPAQSETPSSNKSKKKFIYAVIAVIAVIAVAVGGFFVYKTFFSKNGVSAQNAETSGTKFSVKLDKKWTAKSTPVLLHIISTNMNNDVDMYRAVRPAQGKDTRGSASVQLSAGEYDVEYVSPVNADGSIYKTPKDLSITVDKNGSAKGSTSASDFTFIVADDADASDIEDILSALKEAAKDKKSGVTKKDIAIASKAASANPDSANEGSDAKLQEAESKVINNGKTAFTGIVRIAQSSGDLAKYIGVALGNTNVLNGPYAILLLDKPTGYEHPTNLSDTILMKETASYIILATSSGEPAMNNSVDYWTKYKDKRVVLSGSATSLTYSAQGNYYPYNPFATPELNLEYSAKVSNQKLKSVSLPSGSFTEIVNQDPKHPYNPSSFTLNGSSMDIKHGYDGSTDTYTITEDESGSTAARRTYTLKSSKANDRINHLVYYPDSGEILIGTTRYSVFRQE